MNENKQVIENVTKRPNSICFRYDGTGTDMKLYFENEHDLVMQLAALAKSMNDVHLFIGEIKKKMKDKEDKK